MYVKTTPFLTHTITYKYVFIERVNKKLYKANRMNFLYELTSKGLMNYLFKIEKKKLTPFWFTC